MQSCWCIWLSASPWTDLKTISDGILKKISASQLSTCSLKLGYFCPNCSIFMQNLMIYSLCDLFKRNSLPWAHEVSYSSTTYVSSWLFFSYGSTASKLPLYFYRRSLKHYTDDLILSARTWIDWAWPTSRSLGTSSAARRIPTSTRSSRPLPLILHIELIWDSWATSSSLFEL